VHHFTLDVTAESFNLEGLPEVMQGMAYFPGTIRLKLFSRLRIDDRFASLFKGKLSKTDNFLCGKPRPLERGTSLFRGSAD
jgi:hypothetical protein